MSKEFYNLIELFSEVDAELASKKFKKVNEEIDETVNSLVREAVKHFTKRHRANKKEDPYDDDERYFFNEKELKMFCELNKNPDVKIRTEYDEKFPTKVYCYVAYR